MPLYAKFTSAVIPRIFVRGSCFWLCTPVRSFASSGRLPHTTLSHTQLTHKHKHKHKNNLLTFVAAVALGDIQCHLAWQAWHLVTSTCTLCGRCGTWRHPVSFGVAGVALGDINLHFMWQVWHLTTSTFAFCGRRGAGLALGWLWWRAWFPFDAVVVAAVCVVGVALGDINLQYVVCVAGVALGDIDLQFVWQAWHLATSIFAFCGRPGTWRHRPSVCMAGVALGDIDLRFLWQAWHLATSTFSLCGRRGT